MINTKLIQTIGMYVLLLFGLVLLTSIFVPVLGIWNGGFLEKADFTDYLWICSFIVFYFSLLLERNREALASSLMIILFFNVASLTGIYFYKNHPLFVYLNKDIKLDRKHEKDFHYKNNIYMTLLNDQLKEKLISFYKKIEKDSSEKRIKSIDNKIKEHENLIKKYQQKKSSLINE